MLKDFQKTGGFLLRIAARLFIIGLFITISSALICRYIYTSLVPTNAIVEVAHFDFRLDQPRAQVKLGSTENQWLRLKDIPSNLDVKHSPMIPRSLFPGSKYDINAFLYFAKSPRNFQLGKVVLTLNVIDRSGDAIAYSVRTVPISYQTLYLKVAEELSAKVSQIFGIPSHVTLESNTVSLMNNFVEPAESQPPSDLLDLELSTNEVDLLRMEVVIAPQMSYFTSFLYYHPTPSFLIGTYIFSCIQAVIYTFIYFISMMATVITIEPEEELREELRAAAPLPEEEEEEEEQDQQYEPSEEEKDEWSESSASVEAAPQLRRRPVVHALDR